MTPPGPIDPALMQKVPIPPEVLEQFRAAFDEEETLAPLAEARAQGGYTSIADLLPELDAIARGDE